MLNFNYINFLFRVDPSDPKLNRIISVQKEDIDAAISDINSSSLREEVSHRRPQEDIILVFSTLPGKYLLYLFLFKR